MSTLSANLFMSTAIAQLQQSTPQKLAQDLSSSYEGVNHVRRFREALERLRHYRLSYRFHILGFSERISEDELIIILDVASYLGYAIRLDTQSLGLFILDNPATPHDSFIQIIQDSLAQHPKDERWIPFSLNSIEGRTDEISSADDLLSLAVACQKESNKRQVRPSNRLPPPSRTFAI